MSSIDEVAAALARLKTLRDARAAAIAAESDAEQRVADLEAARRGVTPNVTTCEYRGRRYLIRAVRLWSAAFTPVRLEYQASVIRVDGTPSTMFHRLNDHEVTL